MYLIFDLILYSCRKEQKVEEVDLRDKASYPDGDPYYDSTSQDVDTSKLIMSVISSIITQ